MLFVILFCVFSTKMTDVVPICLYLQNIYVIFRAFHRAPNLGGSKGIGTDPHYESVVLTLYFEEYEDFKSMVK